MDPGVQYFSCITITRVLWHSPCIFCYLCLYVPGYILADTAFGIILPTVKASHHNCFQEFIALPDYNCSTCIFHAKSLSQIEVFRFAKIKSGVFNKKREQYSTSGIKTLTIATSEVLQAGKRGTGRPQINKIEKASTA